MVCIANTAEIYYLILSLDGDINMIASSRFELDLSKMTHLEKLSSNKHFEGTLTKYKFEVGSYRCTIRSPPLIIAYIVYSSW